MGVNINQYDSEMGKFKDMTTPIHGPLNRSTCRWPDFKVMNQLSEAATSSECLQTLIKVQRCETLARCSTETLA